MTSQISVEVVHDPSSRSVHTTSGVGRFVGRNHSPGQLVIASPGTPLLEILVAKDSDEKRHENFSKNFHESCTCFIEYAETDYLRDCALYLYDKMLQLALSYQFSSDMEKEFRIIHTS
ncbi:hypothetical protein PVL29_009408 [Vitis rotundifolia]|uniref:Uncharacterized protein n=1 Tax=Vitis rotundifolia TaxID=103349 RepID=A0AA38ZYB8_VITRO|nr:hypothetical protein PVL29_009408 [Vitis rotundifolia]